MSAALQEVKAYRRAWMHAPWKMMLAQRAVPCRVPLHFRVGDFTVKTVDNMQEMIEVLSLRYKVFHREFAGKKFPLGLDLEYFDRFADILIVKDERKQKVVGTYRLISSLFSNQFYSQSEFDLTPIMALEGAKLELSRACIHRKYRRGKIMNLLWRGVGMYLQKTGSSYLFGCGSVLTMCPQKSRDILTYLDQRELLSKEVKVEPLMSYQMDLPETSSDLASCGDDLLPSLMHAYFRAGALICSTPALDRKFRCIDLLLLFNINGTSSQISNRYLRTKVERFDELN